MASSRDFDHADCFDNSGPVHMMAKNGAGSPRTVVDWGKEEHRRCVAACLVKGVYIIENDSTRRRVHTNALAPPWWENFGFNLLDVIRDDSDHDDQFIIGAIYEHVPPLGEPAHPLSPHYVVAFRGTMISHPKALIDLYLDAKIMVNTLKESKRSRLANTAVKKLVATIDKGMGGACGHGTAGSCIVWLAGHSLGASLALDVGRAMMVEQGYNLPTFLFNPPQVSPTPAIDVLLPIEKAQKAKRDIYAVSYFVKAGLGKVLNPHKERMENLFKRLSPWAPELYVHERDVICKGYIDYFEQRQQVQERFRAVATSAMTLSYRDMFFSMFGMEKEQPHLLPSARLWKSTSKDEDAHALQQWWKPMGEQSLSVRRYSYPL
uniref:Fungal lipase-like domain-containing protein n=1 Tax=Oryza barthii TaxID=65489 RepID=A0A0D3GRV4_9ORYZ